MISHRVRGFYDLFIRVQLLLVLAYYWLHFWLISAFYSEAAAAEPYVVYCILIFLGILVEAFQRYEYDTGWLQESVYHKQRVALRQTLYAATAVTIYLVATKDVIVSRVFLFTLLPALYLLLFTSAWLLPARLTRILFRDQRTERTLLIGSADRVARLQPWLDRKTALGFDFVGFLSDTSAANTVAARWLGPASDWQRVVEEQHVHQVLLLESAPVAGLLREMTSRCEQLGVRLLLLSDLPERLGHPITCIEDAGLLFFGLRSEPLENPVHRAFKRGLDIGVSIPAVFLVLPLAGTLVWLLQRWQSPGPLFYRQNRMGLQNEPFTIIKFRTMHCGNPDVARQATASDPRVFPAGRWLRRYSLDELPQFWNVLRGEMSVVGPRPHLIEHNKHFARMLRNYYVRSFVKPGITGLAQVRGFRGEASDEDKVRKRVESDIDYLENWSLGMDIIIILRTVAQVAWPPKTAV